jgi:hypothetical protein
VTSSLRARLLVATLDPLVGRRHGASRVLWASPCLVDGPDVRTRRSVFVPSPGQSPSGLAKGDPHDVPEPRNNRLWHIPFNRVKDELTEELVRGREDIFFGYEFAIQGGGKTLPDDALEYYFRLFSDPDVLRGSFGFYRAWDTTLAQNEQRATRPLAMPVLDRRSGKLG